MQSIWAALLIAWVGTTIGNLLYSLYTRADWVEKSIHQLIVLLAVALAAVILRASK